LSTPRTTLLSDTGSGSADGLAIYADAGSGIVYGTRTYTTSDSNTTQTITLNGAALAAITSSMGTSDFGIGSSVVTLDGLSNNEFAYGASNAADPAPTLTINTVPEPSAAVMVISATLFLVTRRLSSQFR